MFIFKGISTKDMKIIVEEPENLIAKAPLKHEVLNIEGRDDAIYHPLGYAPVEIPLTLQLLDPSKIDQVLMWLNGEGELIYKNRKTKARIFSEIQPVRTAGIRIINIEIIRAPFWYDLEDDYSKAWGANLIPNGWDSFEPYGSGKNYVSNWDFKDDDMSQFQHGYKAEMYIKEGALTVVDGGNKFTYVNIITDSVPGKVVFRVKAKAPNGICLKGYTNTDGKSVGFKGSEDYQVYTLELDTEDQGNFLVYTSEVMGKSEVGNKVTIDWVQITPVDNQHLVVERAHLGKGLTRIQTWGGNHRFKLIWRGDSYPPQTSFTTSMYIYNLTNKWLSIGHSHDTNNISSNYEGFNIYKFKTKNEAIIQFRFEPPTADDNLDFIASTPTIVEGGITPTWEADENPRIINEGTAPSKPLIKLTIGTSSTCEFEVNDVYFKYHFNHDTEVLIDCEKMEASDNGQLRNRHLTIGYEFPVLDPGPNVVKRISGDAKIEFKRKDRWL